MTQDKIKKIHLIYGCIAAALIVALGIAMIMSCWGIYQSGPRAYSRDSIGAKLQDLTVLIVATFAVIGGGAILHLVLPLEHGKPKAIRDELCIMKKTAAKAATPEETEARQINKERIIRKCSVAITGVLNLLLLAYPIIYLCNRSHFPGVDPTAEITAASLIALPPALLCLVAWYVCGLISSASIRRETAVYKQIIAQRKAQPVAAPESKKAWSIHVIRWAVFAIAIIFIVVGIFNGSANDVLTKAVKICTECIGLG